MKIKQVLPIGFVACLCMCMVFTSWGGRTAADAATVSCADIANLAFTDLQYNKPVIITSAGVKAAVGNTPELCEVKGTIFPQINFIVTIPTTAYNQRFVMVGQGGAAGNINANASLTKQFYEKGFATAATDTGHVTTGQSITPIVRSMKWLSLQRRSSMPTGVLIPSTRITTAAQTQGVKLCRRPCGILMISMGTTRAPWTLITPRI
jgi:hypothetical protein